MSRYVPGLTPTTPDIAQLERWLREETEQIRSSTDDTYAFADFVLETFVTAGYGGIGLDAVTPVADISPTWQQLPFDVVLILQPKIVAYDLIGNGMSLEAPGVWRFNGKVSLTFAEAQAGREIQLSLWDIDAASAVGPAFNFFVGRNTAGVNLNFNVLFDITDFVNKPLGLAVRSEADTYTLVNAIGSIFDINYVSEYKGEYTVESMSSLNPRRSL